MQQYKNLFEIVNRKENIVKLAVRLLSSKSESLFYKKYGRDLNDLNLKKEVTKKERDVIAKEIVRNLIPNIEYLETLQLTDEQIDELLKSDEKTIQKLRLKQYETKITYKTYKPFYSHFESPKYLVDTAIKFLSEEEKKKIYKKYGEDLNNINAYTISPEENESTMYVINKIKIIIKFLEEENIKENDIIDLEKLKTKYYLKTRKPHKRLFSYFKEEEIYIRLSVKFLSQKQQELIIIKYGENLENTVCNKRGLKKDGTYILCYIIPRMQYIIDFLKENKITKEECEYLNSELGKEDLNLLIENYKKQEFIKTYINKHLNKKDTNKDYKRLITKYGLEKAKIILLFIKYERRITIQQISKLLNLETEEIFDTYITYKLENKQTMKY